MADWYNEMMFIHLARKSFFGAFVPLLFILTACSSSSPPEDLSSAPSVAITPYLTATAVHSVDTQDASAEESSLPSASPTPLAHIVVANDTLLGIAQRYGVSLDALLAANPGVNPSFLSLGMEILVPQGQDGAAAVLATPTALPLDASEVDCYATAAGELWCFFLVENQQGESVENMAASIQLFSSAGEVLDSAEATAPLNILQTGASLPLVAYWREAPTGWAHAEAELLSAYRLSDQEGRFLPVELTNVDIDISPTGLSAHLRAGLEPVLGVDASVVWVLALAYDAEGQVLGLRRWEGSGEDAQIDFWVYSLGGFIEWVDLLVEARP